MVYIIILPCIRQKIYIQRNDNRNFKFSNTCIVLWTLVYINLWYKLMSNILSNKLWYYIWWHKILHWYDKIFNENIIFHMNCKWKKHIMLWFGTSDIFNLVFCCCYWKWNFRMISKTVKPNSIFFDIERQ